MQNIDEQQDWRAKNIEEQVVALQLSVTALEHLEQVPELSSDAWLCKCLIQSVQHAYIHLHAGWKADASQLAWGCRNLLELRVFAKFVVQGPENRKRFLDDMMVDTRQMYEETSKFADYWAKHDEKVVADVAEGKRMIEALEEETGVLERRFLQPTILAQTLHLEHLLPVHKFCSKLVHPTAHSILMKSIVGQEERNVLFYLGGSYIFDLMEDLGPFIAERRRSAV